MIDEKTEYEQVIKLHEMIQSNLPDGSVFSPMVATPVTSEDVEPMIFGYHITGELEDGRKFVVQMSEWDSNGRGEQVTHSDATEHMMAIDIFIYPTDDRRPKHTPIRSMAPNGAEQHLQSIAKSIRGVL